MTKAKPDPLIGHERVSKDGTRYSYMGGNWWQQIDHVCFFMETRVKGGDLILISYDRENYLGMYMPLNTAWKKSSPTDRDLYEPTLYYKVFSTREPVIPGSRGMKKNTTHFRHELEQWFKDGMRSFIPRPKDFDEKRYDANKNYEFNPKKRTPFTELPLPKTMPKRCSLADKKDAVPARGVFSRVLGRMATYLGLRH